jgi:signal transduction histidine kinase
MKRHLGDILLEKGYISRQELTRALEYQMRKVLGKEGTDGLATTFLLDVARKKYNNRGEFYLGRILTELKLLPETTVQEALAIQRASVAERPAGKLEALNQVITRMNDSYNLIDLLHQIIVLAAELVEAEAASLIIHDTRRDTLVILMPTGPTAEAVRDTEIPTSQGVAGWVYQNGESAIVNDAASDPRFFPGVDRSTGFTSRQILCVPLTVKSRKLGAVEVLNKRAAIGGPPPVFTAEDQFLLEMFSTQAAIAIENTRLAIALSRLEEEMPLEKRTAAEAERARAATLLSESFLAELKRSFIPLEGYSARMRESPSAEKVDKYGTYIEREMARLVTRAEDIVQFLRDDIALNLETVMVKDLLAELASRTWVDCRLSGVAFEWSVEGEPAVEADRERLLRILESIFRNSREAMNGSGDASARTFRITARPTGSGTVEILASDTGPGVPDTELGKVFEPFYAGGKRSSAGLGLAMARRVIEAHRGSIGAENRSGPDGVAAGAAFTITLPVQ